MYWFTGTGHEVYTKVFSRVFLLKHLPMYIVLSLDDASAVPYLKQLDLTGINKLHQPTLMFNYNINRPAVDKWTCSGKPLMDDRTSI